MYREYKGNKKVAFFLVYVREAHPVRKAANTSDHRSVTKHKTMNSKVLAASKCLKGLKLSLPCLIDTLEGKVERAYRGKPAATAVVDINGKVVFHSHGPRGVRPGKVRKVLKKLLPTQPEPTTQPTSQPTTKPASEKPTTQAVRQPTKRPVRTAATQPVK